MKNTLKDLNNYLFEQIEKLQDENVDLDNEIRKSYAIAHLSKQIINNANTTIKAIQTISEYRFDDKKTIQYLGIKNSEK